MPLFYPVPFALTQPQVAQAKRMWIVRGDSAVAAITDRVATMAMRLAYNRLPLAPRAFAKVARANGVAQQRTIGSLIRADFNLLTEMAWELDGFELPEDFQRVGPIYAHIDSPIPDIARELAADPLPLVYLGLGSSGNRELTLDSARALGTLPINVIAPVEHFLEPGDALPQNVHVTGLLPVHLMGDMLDAAVLHGGQGTVQTACATGVPFVGMGLQPEQTWHVKLCERRGNAISIPPKRAGSDDFIAAVRRLLDDPGLRQAADEVKEAYARGWRSRDRQDHRGKPGRVTSPRRSTARTEVIAAWVIDDQMRRSSSNGACVMPDSRPNIIVGRDSGSYAGQSPMPG